MTHPATPVFAAAGFADHLEAGQHQVQQQQQDAGSRGLEGGVLAPEISVGGGRAPPGQVGGGQQPGGSTASFVAAALGAQRGGGGGVQPAVPLANLIGRVGEAWTEFDSRVMRPVFGGPAGGAPSPGDAQERSPPR
jgi:hypothetical protein